MAFQGFCLEMLFVVASRLIVATFSVNTLVPWPYVGSQNNNFLYNVNSFVANSKINEVWNQL